MNQAAYLACLDPGDTILAMDLSHGGHLTHGAPVSHMGRIFRFVRYRTRAEDGSIDYDDVLRLALEAHAMIRAFCDTPAPGYWYDLRNPDGAFVREPARASSFYHIAMALSELIRVADASA